MGLYTEVRNHDEMLRDTPGKIIYANDFKLNNLEEKEEFNRVLYSHYVDADAIEASVSCDCGHSTEAFKLGIDCDVCGSEIVRSANRAIRPSMWVRTPPGVTSLISPELWIMLSGFMTKKDFDFLEFLTNTNYKYEYDTIGSAETRKKLDRLLARNFPRGLNNFIENFDDIFQFLLTSNIINLHKNDMSRFVQQNKHNLFPQVLPIPTKLCFVVESTTSGIYIDKPIGAAIDAALTFAGIESAAIPLSSIQIQNNTARALKLLGIFHENYPKHRIARKPGLVRRHILGGRLNLTSRAVITSISEPHAYDELYIPWGLACQLLKYHIINKLKRKHRMTAREAVTYVYSNTLNYDPLLDEIFKELIAESKYGKLMCLFGRNPTLQRGSIQCLGISKVMTDVNDKSIRISCLILRAPNADFDGDLKLVS